MFPASHCMCTIVDMCTRFLLSFTLTPQSLQSNLKTFFPEALSCTCLQEKRYKNIVVRTNLSACDFVIAMFCCLQPDLCSCNGSLACGLVSHLFLCESAVFKRILPSTSRQTIWQQNGECLWEFFPSMPQPVPKTIHPAPWYVPLNVDD